MKPVLFASVLLTLGFLTWRQCAIYADFETIWRATLAKNPSCWLARNNLGTVLLYKGRADEAIASYLAALELKPDYAEAHYNAGIAHMKKNQPSEAVAHFAKALELQPDYAEACLNLGVVFAQGDRMDDASRYFQRALKLKPDYAEAHYNEGIALFRRGQTRDAIAHFQRATDLRPDYAEAHRNLAVALVEEGRLAEAIAHYRRVLEINPRNVEVESDLAWLYATCPLASLRNGAKAVNLARRANEATGGENPGVLRTLAAAYAEAGRYSEAVDAARGALRQLTDKDNPALGDALQAELQFYIAGSPFRDGTFKTKPEPGN